MVSPGSSTTDQSSPSSSGGCGMSPNSVPKRVTQNGAIWIAQNSGSSAVLPTYSA